MKQLHVWLIVALWCFALASTVQGQTTNTVKCGVDNLIDTRFELLRGKRVVLVTHAAARARTGRSTFDEFRVRSECTLVRLLTPEHGFYGVVTAGIHVDNDTIAGVPAISLYGQYRRPTPAMLADADVIVIDLQDIGTRSYTFMSTMIEVMEACAASKLPVYILDRPNPLGGVIVDGNVPEDSLLSFVCRIPVPYVHGMTLGELATMTNAEGWLGRGSLSCSLTVVRCKRWTRSMRYEDTHLSWYPTSPNIPTINAVRGYPVTGLLGELGLVHIGIGTPSPFTVIGAPSLQHDTLLEQRLKMLGTHAARARITPTTGRFAGNTCNGYYLSFASDSTSKPYLSAVTMASVLMDSSYSPAQAQMFNKVTGSSTLLELLRRGSWTQIERESMRGVEAFKQRRKQYLLYP